MNHTPATEFGFSDQAYPRSFWRTHNSLVMYRIIAHVRPEYWYLVEGVRMEFRKGKWVEPRYVLYSVDYRVRDDVVYKTLLESPIPQRDLPLFIAGYEVSITD